MSEDFGEGQGWKCHYCGMYGNTLPYCSNCGKARYTPSRTVEFGCLAVLLLIGAAVLGTCSFNGLSDHSQVAYWGKDIFNFSLNCAGLFVLVAVWLIWRAWRER